MHHNYTIESWKCCFNNPRLLLPNYRCVLFISPLQEKDAFPLLSSNFIILSIHFVWMTTEVPAVTDYYLVPISVKRFEMGHPSEKSIPFLLQTSCWPSSGKYFTDKSSTSSFIPPGTVNTMVCDLWLEHFWPFQGGPARDELTSVIVECCGKLYCHSHWGFWN